MKKILAAALAIIMATAVMASCGSKDDSSSKADTASSAAESAANDADSKEDAGSKEDNDEPKDISEMPGELKNQETASLKFTTDMDVNDFASELAAHDFKDDESHLTLSIEELQGVPMLRIQTLDVNEKTGANKTAKIHLDMSKLFKGHEEDLPKIFKVKFDIVTKAEDTVKNDDGEEVKVPTYFGGKLVTQPYNEEDKTQTWNELLEFGESEWTSEWAYYEFEITPGIIENAKFINTTEPQYLAMMKWQDPDHPTKQDVYIANITFLDQDGNVIDCPYGK